MTQIFPLFILTFVCVVNAKFHYGGVKMVTCDDSGDCKQISESEKHYLIPNGIEEINKDLFSNRTKLMNIIGNPGKISNIEKGSFDALTKLRRIWLGGQNLRSIKEGVFTNIPIEYLYLAGNFIEKIEENALAMPGLKNLLIDKNRIRQFESSWFGTEDIQIFENLWMHHNQIQTIKSKAFERLPNIRKIDLSFNEIESIASDAFNTFYLEDLDLSFNRLTTLDAFSGVKKIKKLTLAFNYFEFIPISILKTTKINDLSIHPNPWGCQCLKEFESAMDELNIKNVKPKETLQAFEFVHKYQGHLNINVTSRFPICDYAQDKCLNEATKNSTVIPILEKFYNYINKICITDDDCNNGMLCKSNYCWPLMAEVKFKDNDDGFFTWSFLLLK